jgi:D-tagatose-1,6-bisphosphate aldolase subunit GatZ/KbaZ
MSPDSNPFERADTLLEGVVRAQHRGTAKGIYSVCSASPWVIEACFKLSLDRGTAVLVESTCNQVNQYGGYTGMTPVEFVAFLATIREKVGLPRQRVLLGGDHLGPSPWRGEPAESAMAKSRQLVSDCVSAGYKKIHLDTSMALADDPPGLPLDMAIAAQRTAELAQVAEAASQLEGSASSPPRYIIGTEVPVPGGAQENEESVPVTKTPDVERMIGITRKAFLGRGLEDAWERVIGVVVQPGVEFGDGTLFEYDRSRTRGLVAFIENRPGLVFEAHSTDYQTRDALRAMVEDHFAILKVGPALTFAQREAIFALAMIEEALFADRSRPLSRVREALEAAMLAQPSFWERYYSGDPAERRFARKYSFSDRSRYYWPQPGVRRALDRLITNLGDRPIPLALLSQFLPIQYRRIRENRLENTPQALILAKITQVLLDYAFACRM